MKHLLLFLSLVTSISVYTQEYTCPCNEDDCGDVISDYEIKGTETVVCDGRLFELRNNTNAQVELYIWDWGDGTIDTLTTNDDPSHIYNIPDSLVCDDDKTTYEICLLIIRECPEGVSCHNTRKPITIKHRPRALFDVGPEICVGETLGLDNLSCNADSYNWNFGTGASSEDESPNFNYNNPGNYTITLTVENECGSDEYTQNIRVVDFPETSIGFESANTAMNEACVPSRQIINANNNQWVNSFSWELSPSYTSINGDWCFVDPSLIGVDPCPCLHDSTFTNNTVDSLLRQETLDLWFKEPGVYNFILSASNICENLQIEEQLTLYEPPTINAPAILQECESTEFCFSDLGIQVLGDYNSVSWSFVNGSLSSSSDLDFGCIEFNSSGLMRLEVDAVDPCIDIAQEIEVIIQEDFEATILPVNNPYCQSSSSDTLLADPPGGTWSGEGIIDEENGVFDPSTIDPGTYQILYEISNGPCSSSDMIEIVVVQSEEVTVQDTFLCSTSSPIQLTVSPFGGTFSGNGITDAGSGLFDPALADAGENNISYTYIDANGCEIQKEIDVVVDTIPNLEVNDTIFACLSSDDVDLNDLIDFDSNGESGDLFFSGPGIVDDNLGLFNSSGLSMGFYTIQLIFEGRSCQAQDSFVLELAEKPELELPEDMTVCVTDGTFNLSPLVGSGGLWSSSNCTIDPQTGNVDLAVIGGADCEFTYTIAQGSSCEQSEDVQITILDLDSQIDIPGSVSLCQSNSRYSYSGSFSPPGGLWSGPGIIDESTGVIDLSQLSADTTYTYRYCIESQEVDCEACRETRLEIYPLPTAMFNTDVSPCVNTEFTFINNSTDVSFSNWNFGDGNSSNELQPMHSYSSAGNYDVQLIIESSQGCRDTVSQTLRVRDQPTLDLNITTEEGCAPLELVYENNSFGENVQQYWLIENVDTIFGTQPQIILDSVQTDSIMTVELVVFNDCQEFRQSREILVHPYPIVDFGINDDEGCSPDTVWLVNQTLGLPDTFFWNFGNGLLSSDSMPAFQIYQTPDDSISTYTISLYAENSCGSDYLEKEITVYPNNVDAFFEIDTLSGCPPLVIDIQNYATIGSTISYDFGDGNSGFTGDTVYSYNRPGSYVITQFASLCGTDTYQSDTIIVHSIEEANFIAPTTICPGETIQFENNSDTTLSVQWDFGDGSFSTLKSPAHVYDSSGNYKVSMIVYSKFYNCPDTSVQWINVPEPPVADFAIDTTQFCPYDTLQIQNNTEGAGIFSWDFSDGNGSIERSPSYFFKNPGIYTISLVATDDNGCRSDTSRTSITVHETPKALFASNDRTFCQRRDTIRLDNVSENFVSSLWYLSDSLINENDNNLRWVPTQPGALQVSLIAINEFSCRDTFFEIIEVLESPKADLNISDTAGCQPFNFNFSDQSDGATGRLWSLSGNTFSDPTEDFTLTESGQYELLLIAMNSNECPNDTLSQSITVYPRAISDFRVERSDTCGIPANVQFINLSRDASDYNWNFSNGQMSAAFEPNTIFSSPGSFSIQLISNNQFGCTDTASYEINIYPQPQANFELSSKEVCEGQAISLRNNSQNANDYNWLINQSEISFTDSLIVNEAGIYEITLLASYDGACIDTFAFSELLKVYRSPDALFDYQADLDENLLGDVSFFNRSENASNYLWDFGDGNTSILENPQHVYDANGPFTACLTAILTHEEGYECIDVSCDEILIEPINTFYVPNAMSPDRSFGEDLVRVFKPVGIGVESYELNIYSPWGDKIKTLNEVSDGQPIGFWNGRYKGDLVPQGAYLWKASIVYKNGNREFKSGNVTVIR